MAVIIEEVEMESGDGPVVAREPARRPRSRRPAVDRFAVLAVLRREESRSERLRAD